MGFLIFLIIYLLFVKTCSRISIVQNLAHLSGVFLCLNKRTNGMYRVYRIRRRMNEQQTQQEIPLHKAFQSTDFYLLLSIILITTLTRIARSQERLRLRVIVSELMLAVVMSIFLYFFGLYEGLSSIQIVLIAIPAALGNVRLFNYILTFLHTKQNDKRF